MMMRDHHKCNELIDQKIERGAQIYKGIKT
jgi:hypothetical protein